MFNSLAVDGSDGVCLPRRLGAVQCPVHLGDGRPAKGGVNNGDDIYIMMQCLFVCHEK